MKHPYFKTILLCFCLLASINAFAETVEIDGIYYNFVLKAKLAEVTSNPNDYSGTVNIPETVSYNGITCSVTSIGSRAFYYCKGLTSVTIPNSIKSIGRDAFAFCGGLKKVIVTDIAAWCGIKFDGYDSNPLYYAKHLYSDENTEITNLIIPNSVTSIKKYAFDNCSGLASVTIPNSVTSIEDDAFYKCSGITSVTISNSVKSIGRGAFLGCKGLSSITIPNSVTSIGSYAFDGCSGLTSVTIGNSINNIGFEAFANCKELTDVYCYAKKVPFTKGVALSNAFKDSYTEYATLHVPAASVGQYKAKTPWSNFGTIVATDGTMP